MKRRTKLSLTRNTANHKRARVTEVPQQRHRINEPPSPPPCSNSIPTTCASKFVIGEQELITSKGQEEANPSDSDDLGPSTNPTAVDYGKSLATPDGDCGVSSSQPDCPMSCGSVDVNHVFVDAAAGSGHQMETECTEEDINDTDSVLPPPCVSVADSEQISDFMEDVLTDPIFESEIDLCTQHGPSNSAHYTPPNDETFNMPHRVHRKSPATRQTSLLSFMSTTTSSIHVSTSVPIINSQDNHECQTACTSSARSLTGRGNGAFPVSKSLTETQAVEFSQGIKTQNRVKRTCPFYKRIPGDCMCIQSTSACQILPQPPHDVLYHRYRFFC